MEQQASGEAGRRCPYCPRTFAFPSYLQRHITLHTGEKPFCCPRCGQRYTRRNYLRDHFKRKHCASPPAAPAYHPRALAAPYAFTRLPQSLAPTRQSPLSLSPTDNSSQRDTGGQETLESLPGSAMTYTTQEHVPLNREGAS